MTTVNRLEWAGQKLKELKLTEEESADKTNEQNKAH